VARIGVFVCRCGRNIAGTVDVAAVAETLAGHPGVVHSEEYTYMCSDPGQLKMAQTIADQRLTGVVVAACSPQLHERTFRIACKKGGLNPYMCDMANIREHCSWVHPEEPATTEKAIELTRAAIEKVKRSRPLTPIRIPVNRRVLVIGAGIAGIQVALDVARGGYDVVLVEREAHIGGHMARLSATFPDLERARFLLRPKLAELLSHDNIWLLTNSEVVELTGFVGNFKATIKTRPRSGTDSDDDLSDEVFPRGVDHQRQESTVEVEVGAVVPAIGYDMYPLESIPEYGSGSIPDVLTSLEFERLLRTSEGGELRRPSDGRVPREVVFIQCVRSRDREHGMPYCSRICCMYTAKQAMLYKQRVPDGQAYVFYIDIRAQGKNDEEFIRRATEQYGVLYLRGRVSRVFPQDGKVIVWGADTLSGMNVEIPADAVVMALAMTPARGALDVARMLGVGADDCGFLTEAHPKLRPVETSTSGILLAGACQAPRDIGSCVAHASGAASKVLELFSSRHLEREPEIAHIDENICAGCFDCREVCPSRAVEVKEIRNRRGDLIDTVATVNVGLCQGCGLCVATCRSMAANLEGYSDAQLFSQIEALGQHWPPAAGLGGGCRE
jgi:heterodisulfide reductase subunit A2